MGLGVHYNCAGEMEFDLTLYFSWSISGNRIGREKNRLLYPKQNMNNHNLVYMVAT